MRKLVSALFIAAVSLAGCDAHATTTAFTKLGAPPRATRARDPSTVKVFTASRPKVPFVEVGIVEARARTSLGNTADLLAALRRESAKHGCDAVILVSNDNVVEGPGNDLGTDTLKGYRGTCIMYRRRGAAGPGSAGPPGSRL